MMLDTALQLERKDERKEKEGERLIGLHEPRITWKCVKNWNLLKPNPHLERMQ